MLQYLNGQSHEQLNVISASCRDWTEDLPRSFPSLSCHFTHDAPANCSPGSRRVLPFHGILSFPCKAHIALSVLCELQNRWESQSQSQLNNEHWPSTASSCAPGTRFSFQAGMSWSPQLFMSCYCQWGRWVQKGCPTSGTLVIKAWLSLYFSIKQRRARDQISKAAFGCPVMELSFPLLQHPGLFMIHFQFLQQMRHGSCRQSSPPLQTLIRSSVRSWGKKKANMRSFK